MSIRSLVEPVLNEAFERGGFTTRSDFARSHADNVAIAAQLRLLSTLKPDGSYDNKWRLTPKGLSLLFNPEDFADYDDPID